MVLAPEQFAPPHPVFVALPLTLFAFKLSKLFALYRWRVRASFRESLAAALVSVISAAPRLSGRLIARVQSSLAQPSS